MITFKYDYSDVRDLADGIIRMRDLNPVAAPKRRRNRIIITIGLCMWALLTLWESVRIVTSCLWRGSIPWTAVVWMIAGFLIVGWEIYVLSGRERVLLCRYLNKYREDEWVTLDGGSVMFESETSKEVFPPDAAMTVFFTPRFIMGIVSEKGRGWVLIRRELKELGLEEDVEAFFRQYYQVTVLDR